MIKRLAMHSRFLLLIAVTTVGISVWFDWGSESWGLFQRSGSVVILVGALLGYRSIIRLGRDGVGGASVQFVRATIVEVDDSGPTQTATVSYDQETRDRLIQAAKDQAAGYIGAFLVIGGTFICGYGDFLGQIF